MKLTDLMSLLREHRAQPEECARRLLQDFEDPKIDQLAAAFRTAFALGIIESAAARRLLKAIDGATAGAETLQPPNAAARAWENRYVEARQRCDEAEKLTAKIAELTAELRKLGDRKAASHERLQAARFECAMRESLLQEIGLEASEGGKP